MSVCDASLISDALTVGGPLGDAAADRLQRSAVWHAPHLLPCEVMSAVRGLSLGGRIDQSVAAAARDRLLQMRFQLHAFTPYHERVWELRENATAYDAWYLAIAERLGVPLVTTDAKLAAVPGVRCAVEVVTASSA